MTTLKRKTGGIWETIGLPNNVGMSPQTLGYAQVVVNQSGMGAGPTDFTGLSVSVVVPEGRRIRITGFLSAINYSDATSAYQFLIQQDGVQVGRLAITPRQPTTDFLTAHGSIVVSPSAGTHTYKIVATRYAGAGTTSLTAGTDNPSFILVEDITGSTLPYQPASVPVGMLGYGLASTSPTGITGIINVPGMSVNVTVPAGRTLKITAKAHVQSTVAGDGAIMWIRNPTANLQAMVWTLRNAGQSETNQVSVIISPAAGTHTFYTTLERASGTGSLTLEQNGTVYPSYILVEDITPTPAPANTAPSSTLGYAEVVANQGTFTAATDLTGLTATVTVPAGRRIRITGRVLMLSSVATDEVQLRIMEGGTVLQHAGQITNASSGANDFKSEYIITPTAGTHTYKLMGLRATGSGNVTMYANAADPAYILVEDITGVSTEYMANAGPIGRLGYAPLSGTQAGITNLPPGTPINGLSVNVSVPAGRSLRISAEAYHWNNTAAIQDGLLLLMDGVVVKTQYDRAINANSAQPIAASVVVSPSAGAHTFTVNASAGGGSATFGGEPAFLLVEDITPALEPSSGAPGSTLGYAQITANQFISNVQTDIAGLSLTITVPAGRRIRISSLMEVWNNQAVVNYVAARIYEGATQLQEAIVPLGVTGGNQQYGTVHPSVIVTPSAGTHTYKVSAAVAVTQGAVLGGATAPAFILIEDITGSVWPEGSSVTTGMVASEAWTTYTPLWSGTLGNGLLNGRYQRIGRTVHFHIEFQWGSTTSHPAGGMYFSAPVAPLTARFSGVGDAIIEDVGTSLYTRVTMWNPTNSRFCAELDNVVVGATSPFTFVNGDWFVMDGTYEAAA
jgi:hypothetical protein